MNFFKNLEKNVDTDVDNIWIDFELKMGKGHGRALSVNFGTGNFILIFLLSGSSLKFVNLPIVASRRLRVLYNTVGQN